MDIAFVVDKSGSILKQDWPSVVKFVSTTINELDIGETATR